MTRVEKSRAPIRLAAVAFGLSGAAALVYEVVWQRLIALSTGVGVVSVAVITAAFMTGLGIGSHWGGVVSARVSAARALRYFVAAELGIALFGASSVRFYYDVLYRGATDLYAHPLLGLLVHFVELVPPTILMGVSLPFLTRALVRDSDDVDRTVSVLYAINVLGAAVGALLTPWVLIRQFAFAGATRAAALANVAAALGVWMAGRTAASRVEPGTAATARDERPRYPPRLWMALYALSGFCALGLQVAWFRLTQIGVKATAFTFGTVLFVYLGGLGLGSLAGLRLRRSRHSALRVFLVCECGLIALSLLAVELLAFLPRDMAGLSWFSKYWGDRIGFQLGHVADAGAFLRLYALWPAALLFVPTFSMGIAFATMQRAVQVDAASSSLRVGVLQAANIAGCVLGSLAVGLVFLDFFGTPGSLRAIGVCGLAFAAVGLRRDSPRVFLPLTATLAALVLAVPSSDRLWKRLHGRDGVQMLIGEDASGVIGLSLEKNREWWLWINGRSISWLPFGGIHTPLGALPALLHEAPRDIAIIGLGSGNTAWAAACRPETERETVFEIMSPQGRLLSKLSEIEPRRFRPPRLHAFLSDPRVRILWNDGRNELTHDDTAYDIIEADALLPETEGSGNLYSVEFFELAAKRLKAGGLMCTWAPTPRVTAAFAHVFPHVVEFSSNILVGSMSPLDMDLDLWESRGRSQPVSSYLGAYNMGLTIDALRAARPLSADARSRMNRDLFPTDEFVGAF